MLVATFVVEGGLKMPWQNVPRQIRKVVQLEREVTDPQIQKAFVMT